MSMTFTGLYFRFVPIHSSLDVYMSSTGLLSCVNLDLADRSGIPTKFVFHKSAFHNCLKLYISSASELCLTTEQKSMGTRCSFFSWDKFLSSGFKMQRDSIGLVRQEIGDQILFTPLCQPYDTGATCQPKQLGESL